MKRMRFAQRGLLLRASALWASTETESVTKMTVASLGPHAVTTESVQDYC